MSQQINLFVPILLAQRQYFSSRAILGALLLFCILGGGLVGYSLWNLNQSIDAAKLELTARTVEKAALQTSLQAGSTGSGLAQQNLITALKAANLELTQRQSLLLELKRGLVVGDDGHSARLRLIAYTIPAAAWITNIVADERHIELRGLTSEPAVLNDWMAQLSRSPLLQSQSLAAVRVEQQRKESQLSEPVNSVARVPPPALGKTLWSFVVTSAAVSPSLVASGAQK